ncbi:MAG: MBL fold metallo-hydrolase [Oligoflexia bacterium]|nr:MAG: MBL fold metallo-hydrolase [Oligoflexia bacterium]
MSSDLRIEGLSLSGIRTAIAIPELSLCFDVAQGHPFVLRQRKFFISHGHLDHAAGIPFIISQKKMHNEPPPQFYMPPSLIAPLTKIVETWAQIEQHNYSPQFHPVDEKSRIFLNPQYDIQPFRTCHRIESYGYCLIEKKKKLKKEFQNLSQKDLQILSQTHTDLNEVIETPLISFSGDTTIDFLDKQPWAKKSKTLLIECTYLDQRKTVAHAREWGHIHFDELLPRLSELECEKIILIHLSSRYSDKEAQKILSERLPGSEKDRVVLFPGR